MTDENGRSKAEMDAYLARIRKTIADSQNLVSQAELRIAETDRMLEQHGLTREQVMAMKFSDAQLEAVNDELKRRGLDPLEKWNMSDSETPDEDPSIMGGASDSEVTGVSGAELENRQRKFGMMMKPFQI
jgi:hypothetical protein